MKIGMKIKELRIEKAFTQEMLSEKLQVSRSTISSWETGRSYPELQMVVDICDLFEVSLDVLLREDTEIMKKFTFDYRLKRMLMGVAILAVLLIFNGFLSAVTFQASAKGIVVEEVVINRDMSYMGGDSERDWNTTIQGEIRSKNPFFEPVGDDFLIQKDGDELKGTVYWSFNFFNLFKQRKASIHQSLLIDEKQESETLVLSMNGKLVSPKVIYLSEMNQEK